ncbi:MAG: DUF4337 domain-containing protein, partial [Myxococcales bacterium]|nr:DUF4337 domain-containing protein [Myxococcales bacterium]
REEVAHQRQEESLRDAREKRTEALKNRVALAAIVLTTVLSFIGNIKGNRNEAVVAARDAAEAARRQSAELWAYYQTKLAERTSLELAHDRLRLDLVKRGISREDPSVKLEALKLTDYERRIRDFDSDTQQVFYRVQELERREDLQLRRTLEPSRATSRYEIASKLITLALILLSVTILSNKQWLFASGLVLGAFGVLLAFDAYLLLF